jgi:type IV fimbrial biogenesis protein FimT
MGRERNPHLGLGYSLLELLVTVGIGAILVGLSLPSFRELILDSRRVTDINALVHAVQLARSEAAKRRLPVVLCKTANRVHCGNSKVSWSEGWMVFANLDDQSPPQRSPEEPLIWAHQPAMTGSITGNRASFHFRPFFWRSTNGTITFCDERGVAAARAVIISYTGRPRVSSQGPGRPLSCANPL